jgi:hypothetical protein
MSTRYAPLPSNPVPDLNAQRELDDAFDESDDEHDESSPLNPAHSASNINTSTSAPNTAHFPTNIQSRQQQPGTYDFECVDYDYPPPGSPPPPSSTALPNQFGNTNGLVPSFDDTTARPSSSRNWLRNVFRMQPRRPSGAIGGGGNNDGVFANVTAKPSAPVRVQDGDDTYLVPEDSRAEAPPSYSSAQADAVPPYWETTIHVPFATDASELIIDSLPTGTLFSFLWNLLVSMSFQFIGFLLTYLLHTTHAARLGSRAGLGVTLIQFGFALRQKMDGDATSNDPDTWKWKTEDPVPTFSSASEADAYASATNTTLGSMTDDQAGNFVADATAEWLSFFLMTVGWFILLTSFLGFWRVKRWERGIMTSQLENPHAADRPTGDLPVVSQLERMISARGLAPGQLFRTGFGFGGNRQGNSQQDTDNAVRSAEEGRAGGDDGELDARETDYMIPSNLDPERDRHVIQGILTERRLQADLRAAGFL